MPERDGLPIGSDDLGLTATAVEIRAKGIPVHEPAKPTIVSLNSRADAGWHRHGPRPPERRRALEDRGSCERCGNAKGVTFDVLAAELRTAESWPDEYARRGRAVHQEHEPRSERASEQKGDAVADGARRRHTDVCGVALNPEWCDQVLESLTFVLCASNDLIGEAGTQRYRRQRDLGLRFVACQSRAGLQPVGVRVAGVEMADAEPVAVY